MAFSLLEKDGLKVKVHPMAYNVPEFRAILDKYKGKTHGEFEAMKEICYLFTYCDYRSQYSGLSDDKRHQESKYNAELPTDWKQDDVMKAAIAKYNEIMSIMPTLKVLKTGQRGLNLIADTMDTAIREIEKVHKKLKRQGAEKRHMEENTSEGGDGGAESGQVSLQAQLDQLITYTNTFMNMVQDVPKNMKKLDEVFNQVKKEESDAGALVGDRKLGNREIPRKSYE